MEVLASHMVERIEVAGGRIPLLGPADVEPDGPLVAPPHGKLGDLERPGELAHTDDEDAHDDRVACGRGSSLALGEAFQDGTNDLVETEVTLDVELRREPNLGVHDPVGRQILGALCRN